MRPEERVRRVLVEKMVSDLGYPKSLIVIEQQLKQMPHLPLGKYPARRFDVVCYAKGSIAPLLVIECKACPLTEDAKNQVIGYNYYIKAPFIAVANAEEIQIGYFDSGVGRYQFQKGLPSYEELISCLKRS